MALDGAGIIGWSLGSFNVPVNQSSGVEISAVVRDHAGLAQYRQALRVEVSAEKLDGGSS